MKSSLITLATVISLFFGFPGFSGQDAGHGKSHYNVFPKPVANSDLSTTPNMVKLIAPAFNEKLSGTSATLKWTEDTTAAHYHVQVAKDPNFKWLVLDDQTRKEAQVSVDNLEAGKLYFWRVLAVKPGNIEGHTKGYFAMSSFETK